MKKTTPMEIQQIKDRLTLAEVIKHYGLKADKHNRINCPFHQDKTPSMQLYWKTHTCYCFSSNCKTHGKSMDVIDFIMYKENCTKHQAIKKAQAMITGQALPVEQLDRSVILTNMFTYFKNAVHNSKPAKEYIRERGLDYTQLEIGYNSGQFHHGARKDETLIKNCLQVGLLSPHDKLGRTGSPSYRPFAKYCLVFALKNKADRVTGLYFRSAVNQSKSKHYYLKNSSGLYPGYPDSSTERLILTEAIIDAATLLQNPEITGQYSILSAYGTNRLTDEHMKAIKQLKQLKEIIFAFDNDDSGNKAVAKYAEELNRLFPRITLSKITLAEQEDINSTAVAHQPEIFSHLLEIRTVLFFSTEKTKKTEQQQESKPKSKEKSPVLETKNPFKIRYTTQTAHYYIQGGVGKVLDNMKVTLVVERFSKGASRLKFRGKVDLYEDRQVEKLSKEVAEKLDLRKDLLAADLYQLTDLLDEYREQKLLQEETNRQKDSVVVHPLTVKEKTEIETFLKKPGLVANLNELLGKCGIVGEENSRIFLLIIATSYKMHEPLHALIQGSSGSGKTRLLKQISDCIPQEKVTKLTRVSDKVLYNYPEKFFVNRLLCLEDIDGLSEEAEFAFRELQSNGELNSAISIKLDNGQITSGEKTVKGPIASLACTTKGEIYEDNMSRVFLIAVDETCGQTRRIIDYQNSRAAGEIDYRKEAEVRAFIQNLVRYLEPLEVVNPFASKIHLPQQAHKIRRLNDLFQSFIKQITLVNQLQRRKDQKGRLITEIEDVETAIGIMFESIVLKVDELDGSLRQFFEKLKHYVREKTQKEGQGKSGVDFTRFEVREATGLGKTQQHHYINKLLELEYLQQFGYANRGFKYKIVHWDNYTALREKIKTHLSDQLEQLKDNKSPKSERQRNTNRTPGERVRLGKTTVNQ